MIKERVTVDFDKELYYLDREYWESWDNYGEEMAEEINKLLDKQDKRIKELEKEEWFKSENHTFFGCDFYEGYKLLKQQNRRNTK